MQENYIHNFRPSTYNINTFKTFPNPLDAMKECERGMISLKEFMKPADFLKVKSEEGKMVFDD